MGYGVIFDLDGTLIDSAIVILEILNSMRVQRQHHVVSMDFVRPHLSKGGRTLVAESLAEAAHDPEEDLKQFRDHYRQAHQGAEIIYPGVIDTLERIRALGYPMGICTNKPSKLCASALEQTGLAPYFSAVVTAGEALPAKPDPTAYLQCCALLGISPADAVLVGDSEVDQATAARAGSPFILVKYGYPVKDVASIHADVACSHAAEIAAAVTRVFSRELVD